MEIFKNRNVLVTGGSGGIGREICRTMAHAGANILIFSRNEEKGKRVVDELRNDGRKAEFFQTDIGDSESINFSVSRVREQIGSIDVLINNAAISGFMGPVTTTPVEELQSVLNVNLVGAFQLARDFLPGMINNKFGRIINISSVASRVNPVNSATYNISKAGLDALTKSLSREAASYGITVNSIAPGLILTDRIVNSRLPGLAEKSGNSEEDILRAITCQSDTQKLTTETEIAELVLFLCSNGAGNITGEVINLSGGY